MKYINEVKLNFPAKSANEAFARSAVAAFTMQLDPTISQLADIKTSVSEAVTNSIVHGYKGAGGVIYITVRISDDNVLSVKIRDKGCGIEDIEKAMEPLFTTGGEERAGLGFAVMQSFMDSIKVSSKVGKGTTVTLKKKITKDDP
ncbi:MAG: anti-sigma F factor [Ruminococcus sp.]|nr:anti-sigma F factor [Ruminococcus sp.]